MAVALGAGQPALAQAPPPAPDPTELDPNAPMAPLPDLGVDWPDMDAPDEPGDTPSAAAPPAPADAATAIEDNATIRYTLTLQGLEGVGDSTAILAAFRKQSALEADRKQVRQRRADQPPVARGLGAAGRDPAQPRLL